jgi:hypothetical protein
MLHKLHTFLTISLRVLPNPETFFQTSAEHIAQNAHLHPTSKKERTAQAVRSFH